jgi:uncharacterized GH25 family protein
VSNVAKIVVPLVLAAAAAGGAYYFLTKGGATPIAPPSTTTPTTGEETTKTKPVAPIAVTRDNGGADASKRVEASPLASGNANADAPQGVKGRVLMPDGTPAVGVQVMLLENAMNNAIEMFLRNKTGQVSPALSSAVTVEDGSFALGVVKPGQSVDLRVVSEQHPEVTKSPIKVRSEDWYDTGDLRLEQGVQVQGRVIDTVSKAPVANATVYMNSSNRSHMMSATPGRERGIITTTDSNGFYRFDNGPSIGLINLLAEADGYASGNALNKNLKTDALNEFNLEIERGRTITGVVVDEQGNRIRSAKILANGLSTKTPQTETVFSDDEGEFSFPPLRSGPYRLACTANRFADLTIPVALTDEDIKIVLAKRGSVKLRVLTPKNRPVKAYRMSLKRAFPNNPNNIGNVMDFPDRNINPGQYQGQWAIIEGLPSGSFRFQITERNHAKTLSEMFLVEEGQDSVEVTCILTSGATIEGTVIDDQGQPVSGALVTSDMNAGLAAGSGIFDMFRTMIPEKHTTRNVRTNKQGRFSISKLSFADYMIRVSHQSYCEGSAVNIKLTSEGQVADAGVIRLEKGTLVEGVTTVDGNPAGQVKVVISMPTPDTKGLPTVQPNTPEGMEQAAKRLFNVKVLSDGNGNYTMMKRIPPGVYKVTASRQSANNPFATLLDMKQSELELVIAPGQDRITVNFNLASR